MRLIFLTIFAFMMLTGFTGCFKSTQASRSTEAAEMSALRYQENVHSLVEAFIKDYRTTATREANRLYNEAKASITNADGTASAKNLEVISNQRIEHFKDIELTCATMREKLIAADRDIEHLLKYTAALKDYFNKRTEAAELLNKGTDQTIKILDSLIGGKK